MSPITNEERGSARNAESVTADDMFFYALKNDKIQKNNFRALNSYINMKLCACCWFGIKR